MIGLLTSKELATSASLPDGKVIGAISDIETANCLVKNIWNGVKNDTLKTISKEPVLEKYLKTHVIQTKSFELSLVSILATKLCTNDIAYSNLERLFVDAYENSNKMIHDAAHDMHSIMLRDAAVNSYMTIHLYFKGFHAVQCHRLANYYWSQGRKEVALLLQSRSSEVFGVDIHPACRIGKGIMFDHATGIVIGETAVIDDNVSILQSVTLGGTGNEVGDRHPKIRSNVMIGAGAKVLGNIEISQGAMIGAGSVVLSSVPANRTVAGVPAKIVGRPRSIKPSESMNQNILENA